ncbi:MAG: single-stranded DNA-binding protein [Bacilli bacterium]|nr:single-stranded DNA-binding protein [Bacilli bacterium]
MLNNVMLVGRLANDIEKKTLEGGKEVLKISLAVSRSYKNPDGIYETDFIDCVLWDELANNLSEYCRKGDVIGVRGRLQVSTYEKDDIKRKVVEVVAEKITFLSSKHKDEEE